MGCRNCYTRQVKSIMPCSYSGDQGADLAGVYNTDVGDRHAVEVLARMRRRAAEADVRGRPRWRVVYVGVLSTCDTTLHTVIEILRCAFVDDTAKKESEEQG